MKARQQYAALPYIGEGDQREFLLITTRGKKRWIVPKGWPKGNLPPHELAALEAYEEAGVAGDISTVPIGQFRYMKNLEGEGLVKCKVDVFPLKVEWQYLHWPEQKERRQRWIKPKKAASMVKEQDLAKLICNFARELITDESRK